MVLSLYDRLCAWLVQGMMSMLPLLLQAVSTDHAGTVCVWHVASGKLRFAFANTHGSCRISAATFDSNHRRLITGEGGVVMQCCSRDAVNMLAALPQRCMVQAALSHKCLQCIASLSTGSITDVHVKRKMRGAQSLHHGCNAEPRYTT